MKIPTLTRRQKNVLFFSFAIIFAVVLFYILALAGIGIPCLFYKYTGLLCPGCGNSRAALALLRLDLLGALNYNLLFPLEFFYIAWVYVHCCRSYLRGKPFSYKPPYPVIDTAFLILVLLWWIIRNII